VGDAIHPSGGQIRIGGINDATEENIVDEYVGKMPPMFLIPTGFNESLKNGLPRVSAFSAYLFATSILESR
jgi:hypothetical protein